MSLGLLNDTAVIAAVLGLLHVFFSIRVGGHRFKTKVSLGDGGNKQLEKLIRGHGNFVENVPMALIIIALLEIGGASSEVIFGLGISLIVARIVHYITIVSNLLPWYFRPIAMTTTLLVIMVGSIMLLF